MIPKIIFTSCFLNATKRGTVLVTPKSIKNVSFCTSNASYSKFPFQVSTLFPISLKRSSAMFHSDAVTENMNESEKRMMLSKWIEMCRFEGEFVPQNITEEQFQNLLDAKSLNQRKKYLIFLSKREWASKKDKARVEKKRELKKIMKEENLKNDPCHIQYGLWRNSMFGKTYDQTILDFHHYKLSSAMIDGQPLVLDLGFENHMTQREIGSLAEQLILSISWNRTQREPFNITLCNADIKSRTFKGLGKRMPSLLHPNFPINISSQTYLDLFPKEKLVYLTPDARQEMTTFDPDAVYVIGGIVDLGKKEPLTLAKAKRERIKMQKLPLDRFHLFRHNKSLGIHVVMAILLDLQQTGDWKKSLENIPRRLIQTSNDRHSHWDQKRSVVR